LFIIFVIIFNSFQFLSLEALNWKASLQKTRNVVVVRANWWNVYTKIRV